MNGLTAPEYLAIFGGSAFLALVITPLVLRFALRRQIMDEPGGHKRHDSPVPYLGGIAIVGAFVAAVLAAALLNPPVGGIEELATILGLGFALAVTGLVDDLRGLPVWLRFLVQVGAGAGLWFAGIQIEMFRSDPVNLVITVGWVVGVTNAFNLLDNMDALSAGVAAIASFFFFIIGSIEEQFLVAALSLALAGCALGFLRHNLPPARIYMGDAGSLFLGFMLAAVGVKLQFNAPMRVTFVVPILVLGIAIFDTALVTVSRVLHGRSPLEGGRDHTSHRLVYVGIPASVAVSLICGGAVALGWLAVVMSRIQDKTTGFLLMGFVLATSLFLGILLGLVPVYDNSRRKRVMIREVEKHTPEPEDAGEAVSEGPAVGDEPVAVPDRGRG